MWGIDPRMTSYLSVGVYSEKGEEKAATTSISYQNGAIVVKAYDFTFSTNTVSAKVKVKAGMKCLKAGVRIVDFICTKKGKRLVWALP